jgi:hypothetical protein
MLPDIAHDGAGKAASAIGGPVTAKGEQVALTQLGGDVRATAGGNMRHIDVPRHDQDSTVREVGRVVLDAK